MAKESFNYAVQKDYKRLERLARSMLTRKTLVLKETPNYSSNTPSPESADNFWLWTIARLFNYSYRKENPIKIIEVSE